MELENRDRRNAQELASTWGEVRVEFDRYGAALRDAYTILGERDFLAIFETEDREAAFKSALTLRRHGLNA
ncbi:GYD domain-containing protein [Natrialba asiatica]|uniref:GYD domain-containing protein n=1 Tax=Natrialba asiatica TaxID=64602 RepID=UPI000677AB5D|nr:GYD domain-containing protein [Natrialba asiatica]